MKWLDRMVSKVHAEPAPFDCAWCAGERRHDMCTGKALQPHQDYRLWNLERSIAKVTDCRCALRDHRPLCEAEKSNRYGRSGGVRRGKPHYG